MVVCEIVFSPTGGTRRVARIVSEVLSAQVRTLDLTARDGAWRGASCTEDEVAEHSIVRKYAAGRPDSEDRLRLEEYARRIAERLHAGADSLMEPLPGNRPYRESKRVGLVPLPSRACDGCGACARRCPAGAIDAADPKRVDEARCISCMACVAVCPKSVRRISRVKAAAVSAMLGTVCSGRRECGIFL